MNSKIAKATRTLGLSLLVLTQTANGWTHAELNLFGEDVKSQDVYLVLGANPKTPFKVLKLHFEALTRLYSGNNSILQKLNRAYSTILEKRQESLTGIAETNMNQIFSGALSKPEAVLGLLSAEGYFLSDDEIYDIERLSTVQLVLITKLAIRSLPIEQIMDHIHQVKNFKQVAFIIELMEHGLNKPLFEADWEIIGNIQTDTPLLTLRAFAKANPNGLPGAATNLIEGAKNFINGVARIDSYPKYELLFSTSQTSFTSRGIEPGVMLSLVANGISRGELAVILPANTPINVDKMYSNSITRGVERVMLLTLLRSEGEEKEAELLAKWTFKPIVKSSEAELLSQFQAFLTAFESLNLESHYWSFLWETLPSDKVGAIKSMRQLFFSTRLKHEFFGSAQAVIDGIEASEAEGVAKLRLAESLTDKFLNAKPNLKELVAYIELLGGPGTTPYRKTLAAILEKTDPAKSDIVPDWIFQRLTREQRLVFLDTATRSPMNHNAWSRLIFKIMDLAPNDGALHEALFARMREQDMLHYAAFWASPSYMRIKDRDFARDLAKFIENNHVSGEEIIRTAKQDPEVQSFRSPVWYVGQLFGSLRKSGVKDSYIEELFLAAVERAETYDEASHYRYVLKDPFEDGVNDSSYKMPKFEASSWVKREYHKIIERNADTLFGPLGKCGYYLKKFTIGAFYDSIGTWF